MARAAFSAIQCVTEECMNDANADLQYASPETSGDSLWEMAARHRSAVTILGTVALYLLVLLGYSSALRGEFVWDDDKYVTNNPNLRNIDGLRAIWFEQPVQTQYYPLT